MKERKVLGGGGGISRTSHGGLMSPPGTVRTALDFACSAIVLPPLRGDVGQNTSEMDARAKRPPARRAEGYERLKRVGVERGRPWATEADLRTRVAEAVENEERAGEFHLLTHGLS